MFNEVTWGGYLIWSFNAKRQVFIDGRIENYEDAGVLNDYFSIIDGGPRAFLYLRKYKVHSCLLSPDSRLVSLLSASPEWHEVYRDRVSCIFVKARRQVLPVMESTKPLAPGLP